MMTDLANLWTQLGPAGQTMVASLLAGVVLWAIQKGLTRWPGLKWLKPDDPNAKKKWAAFFLALVPLAIVWYSSGKLPDGLLALLFAFFGSQGAAALAKGDKPK